MLRYFKLKVTVLLLVACLGFEIIHIHKEAVWEHNLSFKIGDAVYVRYGLYEGCTGKILQESYSKPTVGRWGEKFPSKFAGYIIDMTCKGKEVGDTFFVVDFLRHLK